MKVTLQVNGREMTFSEQELVAIVEKHLSSKAIQQTTETKVPKKPIEGEWFKVSPQKIDQRIFQEKREDERQEKTRQLILEAFAEMKENPKKYGKNFKTMMPYKMWLSKTVAQLKKMARELGDHNADWVEQSLEWAQRISNGESWETICNYKDTAYQYRLVVWNNGRVRLVGGSVNDNGYSPASYVSDHDWGDFHHAATAVPLVVLYE